MLTFFLKLFLYITLTLGSFHLITRELTEPLSQYHSNKEKSIADAKNYHNTHQALCRYLAYRDLPKIFKRYANGTTALDYGAGTGISTQLLLENGFDACGVDVSAKMLDKAKELLPFTQFLQVKNGIIPYESKHFDLIFSSFVLFEIATPELIRAYLDEAYRVLKDDGVLIVLTGSERMYNGNWAVFDTDFPENKKPKSGDPVRVRIPELGLEFFDYFWSEKDYLHFIEEAQFKIIEKYMPLGLAVEQITWKDEETKSPFDIFVLKKKVVQQLNE